MAPSSRRPPSPPALMEELIEEILLRIPPDEPAHLIRAALVCKPWRRIILSDHGCFLRRYRAFHRSSPPLLGYLHNLYGNGEGPIPSFVTTTSSSPLSPPPLGRRRDWWALDCRHGRALIHSHPAGVASHLVVWDPISGDDVKRISTPPYPWNACAGAVLCAVDGCDHLDCHAGPFIVVFAGTPSGLETWVSIYSSETGVWGPSVSIDTRYNQADANKPSLLIGDTLYFSLGPAGVSVLRYDLGTHELTVIEPLPVHGPVIFMEVEDGSLGFVSEMDNCIYKWVRRADANGGAGKWEQHMVMELETLLPTPPPHTTYEVVGLVEGTDTIFIGGYDVGVFTLDLKSRKVNKVGESGAYLFILPYMSFYTPDLAMGRLSLA